MIEKHILKNFIISTKHNTKNSYKQEYKKYNP